TRRRLQAHRRGELLDDAFEVEEVHRARALAPVLGVSSTQPSERQRPPFAAGRREAGAELEQPHVALPMPAIVTQGVDDAGKERWTQDSERLREGIGNGNAFTSF